MTEQDLKYKKFGLNVADLERLAATSPIDSSIKLKDKKAENIMFSFFQEFGIQHGTNRLNTQEVFQEFEAWCKFRRVVNIPQKVALGKYMSKHYPKGSRNGLRYYCLNVTSAELRAMRVKKEKEIEKKINKQI